MAPMSGGQYFEEQQDRRLFLWAEAIRQVLKEHYDLDNFNDSDDRGGAYLAEIKPVDDGMALEVTFKSAAYFGYADDEHERALDHDYLCSEAWPDAVEGDEDGLYITKQETRRLDLMDLYPEELGLDAIDPEDRAQIAAIAARVAEQAEVWWMPFHDKMARICDALNAPADEDEV